MSDLLNSASLVLIPSGYKEDVVYSAVPTDGSGDLSFTRASNGTRINSAGLVEVCPWNLAFDSENFGSGYWTRLSSATITTNNTTAPNGTNTGALFSVTSTAYSGLLEGIPDNTQTISMYAKKGTLDYLWFIHENISQLGASFNLNTGVVSFVASGHNASIESVGNGWYRCILSTTNSATWDFFQFGLSNASNSATSPSGGNAYIWGAQANIGSTAKPYFPTTDRLNVPRLTYQNGGGGCPSLLLEKQSTNLALYSEDFTNSNGWSGINANGGSTPIRTANYGISPDGTQNADRIQLTRTTATTSYSLVYQSIVLPIITPQDWTYSVWLKSLSGTPTIQIGGGQVTLTNQWVRYTQTVNYSGGTVYPQLAINTDDAGTSISADFLAWGFQLEASSYFTSYIPTTSASATRVKDVAYKTSATALIGQTEGVLFCDFNLPSIESDIDYPFIVDLFGSTGYRFGFARYPDGGVHIYMQNNFSAQFTYNTTQLTGRFKLALGYKANDCVIYLNGTLLQTITSATIPATSGISFNAINNNGDYNSQSQINQCALFKTRLTNAELASLTTI